MIDWLRRKIAPWRDTLEAITYVIALFSIIVVGIAAVATGGCMVCNAVYSGTIIEYEGTVQAVTRSSFLAPHTTVVLRTYSEDDVSFTLGGYHDFDLGAQYRIRMTMRPYAYGLVCWGKIMDPSNIERLGG